MSLNATIYSGITAGQTGPADLGASQIAVSRPVSQDLASGTGANQVDRLFSDRRTLAASATENLDLAGVLTDAFGVAITFVKIKSIWIKAATANTNSVIVGDATAPFLGPLGGTTPTLTIPPGGSIQLNAPVSGWAVTATTADLIKVANSAAGTTVTYDIVIIGTSA